MRVSYISTTVCMTISVALFLANGEQFKALDSAKTFDFVHDDVITHDRRMVDIISETKGGSDIDNASVLTDEKNREQYVDKASVLAGIISETKGQYIEKASVLDDEKNSGQYIDETSADINGTKMEQNIGKASVLDDSKKTSFETPISKGVLSPRGYPLGTYKYFHIYILVIVYEFS